MKYIKTYEKILYNNHISFLKGVHPEVVEFLEFFKIFIEKNLSKEDSDKIYLEKSDNLNNKDIYSIILEKWNQYIVFQFDFFKDNPNILKIKYLYDYNTKVKIEDDELNMNPFNEFFDSISESKFENIWTIKRWKFMENIDNINMFFDANKYNL